MSGGLIALAGRLEQRRSLLGLAKLANVGLAMIWGFVVTFVFVRLLPMSEFRAFLLLVAFANFTVSAELGFSTIIYSRLRRRHVSGEGDFRGEELGVLLAFMAGIIALGALLIAGALAIRLIPSEQPALFLAFYGVSAVNLIALLARRALAALDHNLWWEALDFVRRLSGIALLLAALVGLPLLTAVLVQLGVALLAVIAGLMTVQRSLAMPLAHWWSLRTGSAHVRAHYLADIGRTSLLTLSDIAAYNAPYFTIVAATHDPRPLLLFDFIFKFSRALSALIRAIVETMLPDLTRHFIARSMIPFRTLLARCLALSLAMACALCLLLLLLGSKLSSLIFDGKIVLNPIEIAIICVLLIGLTLICVSVYLNNGLGRFAALVPPSLGFLCGSLASVPIALWLAQATALPFAGAFAMVLALAHLALAAVHGTMLGRLGGGRST